MPRSKLISPTMTRLLQGGQASSSRMNGVVSRLTKRCARRCWRNWDSVAFAADIYGKGVRPTSVPDKMAQSGKYSNDRTLLRARMTAALDLLRRDARVDTGKIAAIGFCFGGTAVLELARSGAEIAGVVTFHGGLSNPSPQDDRNIKGRVLVLHGADDPLVPKASVDALEKQLTDAKVDWQVVLYSGTVHSFTNPASNDPAHGVLYNERSDVRSWTAMQDFLREVFAK